MTAQQQAVIGIDVGTTAVKAAAFGLGGERFGVVTRRVSMANAPLGRAEQNPIALRKAVIDALSASVRSVGGTPVRAVSLSTAMHGLIGLDAKGHPCTPLVTWADGRAEAIVRDWRTTSC